jgi:macrolide transport system ATP-binding/permease protein
MRPILRRVMWWLRGNHKEAELREELEFHLEEEARERQEAGLAADEARWAASRDLGNEAKVREAVRSIWTWRPVDELRQDLRFAFRTLFKQRAVALFAIASLALGIGANGAIYSFIDALLLRSLPVNDPSALVVMSWRSKPFTNHDGNVFVLHSIWGRTYETEDGVEAQIFPWQAFERLQELSSPVLSSVFARFPGEKVTVLVDGDAEQVGAEYVTGQFFQGVGIVPAAGRVLMDADDRRNASPVAVISGGLAERRFGAADRAVGRTIQINNHAFVVVGVTPREFQGIDPGVTTSVYLPMQTGWLFDSREANDRFGEPDFYWAGIMGRLRPGVTRQQATAALSAPFAQWVETTATNDAERANLPVLRVDEGRGGLDTLRRKYATPLYLLFAMAALILAMACANTASLLLARAASRQREIAVRLSIGAGRFRLIRQLLTESLVLSLTGGVLGVAVAAAGMRMLMLLLAASGDGLIIRADLNWRVLAVTAVLSTASGLLFGMAPVIQSTRPALIPALKETSVLPRYRLREALVVGQIALLMLLLISAGLLLKTLSNLQSIPLGFNRENLLLFEINAPRAGHPEETASNFYDELRRQLAGIPGVRAVTLSHSSLLKAGRGHPVSVDGKEAAGTRFMQTGPAYFSTMQIPIRQGREIDEHDGSTSRPVVVISEQFARTFMPNQNPIGRHITVGGSAGGYIGQLDLEVIGVAADTRYGPLKGANPPVIFVPYPQLPVNQVRQMVYALRTEGAPMGQVAAVRQVVHDADSRIPITSLTTEVAEIDETMNQEIVLARLGTTFAILALTIACLGLYGTMAYCVARRTREIGIRMALGARRAAVTWMVLREVAILTAFGLAISLPLAKGTSRFITSFLFDTQPNDPATIALALATLLMSSLLAAYGPARRATKIDPTTALRQD